MVAAIGMIVIGIFIAYHSYEGLIHPDEIKQPIPTMIVLSIARCHILTQSVSDATHCQQIQFTFIKNRC